MNRLFFEAVKRCSWETISVENHLAMSLEPVFLAGRTMLVKAEVIVGDFYQQYSE